MGKKDGLWAPMAQELIWPNVYYPRVPVLYLDLNHFINLAKSQFKPHAAPAGYGVLLETLDAAVVAGRIAMPLSFEHVWEMYRIKDPAQRRDIAEIMERLSGFMYLLPRPTLARLELHAGLDYILGEDLSPTAVPLVRRGIGTAFGVKGGIQVVDEDDLDASVAARAEMGVDAFESFMRTADLTIERALLRGPPDEFAEPVLSDETANTREGVASRLDYELDTVRRLDEHDHWRRGRLRDVISAREMSHEWLDALNDLRLERAHRGGSSEPLTPDQYRILLSSAPHIQVAVSLKSAYHRNPRHRWDENDITDIDALSVAFPYCRAILTDRAMRAKLADTRELRASFEAALPRTPLELCEWIEGGARGAEP